MMRKPIFPTPRSAEYSGKSVRIARLAKAELSLSVLSEGALVTSAKEYIESELNSKFAILGELDGEYKITLSLNPTDSRLADKGDEAYAISVTDSSATLVGAGEAGLFYAAITLMELCELKGEKVYLPVCEIVDYPKHKVRGVLVESRYNDFMTLDDWKAAVDDFSRLKLNKLEVAVYGSWSLQYDGKKSEQQYIPFKSLPEFNNPKARKFYSVKNGGFVNIPDTQPEMYSKDFFGDVIAYGKKKNVEVFPLFNSYGHNTLLPRIKPEISAVDADGNVMYNGLCTSNEETYKTIFALYDEIIDSYLAPNGVTSFAVGLDEVGDAAFCKCPRCRVKEKTELFTDHAIKLVKYLKGRGMTDVYVYDDMYLYIFDNLNDELAEKFKKADVYDVTVMDWWNYGARKDFFRGLGDKLNNSFKKSIIRPMSGYWHWQGWSDNTLNITYCAQKGQQLGYDGMISYSTYEPALDFNYACLAEYCWAPLEDPERAAEDFAKKYFERHYPDNPTEALEKWNTIAHRLHPYNYDENPPANSEFAQYMYSYKKADIDYPRNHIAEAIAKIEANPYRYLTYLRDLNGRARVALEFFDSDKAQPSAVNENIVTTVSEQYTYSDEYLTLYRIYEGTKTGKMSNSQVKELVSELIRRRKAHMLKVENSRLESIRHQTLRMMTMDLEYLWEMLDAVERCEQAGESFVYDPVAAIDRTAPVFSFLR